MGAASTALLALGGCGAGSSDDPAAINATEDKGAKTLSGVQDSLHDDASAKKVVAPGETVILHDEPDSHVYSWTGDLQLAVTDARILEGQEALEYAVEKDIEIPDDTGYQKDHTNNRITEVTLEVTALDGFFIDDAATGGFLPGNFELRYDKETCPNMPGGTIAMTTATYADGTSAISFDGDPVTQRSRINLEIGKTTVVTSISRVPDDVPADSLVIRPAINSADICTLELGLS